MTSLDRPSTHRLTSRALLATVVLSGCLLGFLGIGLGCKPSGDAAAETDLHARALRLLEEVPLIDGHNDLPWQVRKKGDKDVTKLNLREPQPQIHTDIPRLREGGVGGQFWSVFVPTSMELDEAVTATIEQIDIVHQLVRHYPDTFQLALTADEIEEAHREGRIASLIGMEGGHSINSSLLVLRMLYRLGARYMTLTHSKNTPWADSSTDDPVHDGLSPLGEEIVLEMNRLGMLIDLSHVSPATMLDTITLSEAPVIFSHSSSREICDHARNVPDDILKRLPEKDGLVMITFVPSFVNDDVRQHSQKAREARDRFKEELGEEAEESIQEAMKTWRNENPPPKASLTDVADHIEHVRKIAGINHVGIGSDFDGISAVPEGLEDVSTYPDLLVELLKRGYGDDEIKKLLGQNLLRVFRKVEQVAAGRPKG